MPALDALASLVFSGAPTVDSRDHPITDDRAAEASASLARTSPGSRRRPRPPKKQTTIKAELGAGYLKRAPVSASDVGSASADAEASATIGSPTRPPGVRSGQHMCAGRISSLPPIPTGTIRTPLQRQVGEAWNGVPQLRTVASRPSGKIASGSPSTSSASTGHKRRAMMVPRSTGDATEEQEQRRPDRDENESAGKAQRVRSGGGSRGR